MNNTEYKPLTIGNWIVTFIILAIPIVNIIMLIVWAASSTGPPSRRSYAQATLILFAVVLALAFLFGLLASFLTFTALSPS